MTQIDRAMDEVEEAALATEPVPGEEEFFEQEEHGPVTTSDVLNLVSKRHIRDRAKAEYEAVERDYRAAEGLVWDKMDANGDASIKKDLPDYGIVRIVRRNTIYSRVADLDVLLDSLEQEGRLDELTKPGIEKKRLNELVRECLETGTPIPEGADFYEKRYIQITENA